MDSNKKKYWVLILALLSVLTSIYLYTSRITNAPRPAPAQLTEAQIFTNIYSSDMWGGGSGFGSRPENATAYMSMLRGIFSSKAIKTIADLGCGDWQLMEKIKVPNGAIYKGFDLVESVIETNKAKHAAENIHFFKIENLNDFINVKADLLIVKDVIQHWSHEQVKFFLEKILPNFKYALITNCYIKGINAPDLKLGDFHPIDLQAAPFDEITRKMNIKFFMDYPSHGNIKRVYIFENAQPYVFD